MEIYSQIEIADTLSFAEELLEKLEIIANLKAKGEILDIIG